MDLINTIVNALPGWLNALLLLVPAANAITALTKTNWDNKIVNGIFVVLNFLSMNFGKNKNADS